ncbi:MAG: c-type cytochrome biogenesis protein CcmI, partial [Thiobacillus sp.]|nr:c-type cytochrome biogenesis protein CcmI [Thiobacillus sp.]
MTLVWRVCAVLLVIALLFVVLPLWRATSNNNDVLRDAANLEILRDQAAEMDKDLHNGLLTQEAYEQGKLELQARLLEEVKSTEPSVKKPRNPAKALAIVLAVLLPIFSVSLYLVLGNTKGLLPQESVGLAQGFGTINSAAKLQELENKLEQQPENPDGWLLLARSYSNMQRFADAVRAYEQLLKLVPDEAQFWADYADVYAMNNNQSLLGEPTRFINKALELDGNNFLALALSGSAAMERGDYAAAIAHWTKLTGLLPPDNPELPMFQNGIKQARQFLAMQNGQGNLTQLPAGHPPQKATAAAAEAIAGTVSLSPELAGKAAPTDTVFVFARAARDAQGKKMLLAALRKQVKDLPLQFTFDDSMAMQPQAKLSSFEQFEVVARVSKTGNPIAQPGDLQGT